MKLELELVDVSCDVVSVFVSERSFIVLPLRRFGSEDGAINCGLTGTLLALIYCEIKGEHHASHLIAHDTLNDKAFECGTHT